MSTCRLLRTFTALVLLSLGAAMVPNAVAQEPLIEKAPLFSVGVAEVDVTPDYPIRMNGFLNRKVESVGVRQQVWAKALAIGADDQGAVVLITVDTLGIPAEMHKAVGERLHAKAGLSPEHLCITASHSHTAPMINGCAPNIFGEPIPPNDQAHIDRYTRELTDKLEEVAQAALKDRRDATLHWGIGTVTFAKNRRDKAGPFDHDLPMLVVREPDGRERAIYVSYACHCVTLSEPMIGGDWAGYAQQQIEKRYPHAVAMVSIGCAGDQNPNTGVVNDRADLALGQGEEIAVEVDRLLATRLRPVTGPVQVMWDSVDLPLATLPTREEYSKLAEAQTPTGYHARVQLAKLDRGEKLRDRIDYPVVSWSFGNSLAMVFLAGEVVSEYGLRIKTELDGRKLWVNAYANACPCYIPSEKVLKAGGYEGAGAMIYYDQPTRFAPGLEQKIIDLVLDQLKTSFPPQLALGKGQGTRPRAAEQALALMRTHSDLQVDLVVAEPLVVSPVAVDFGPDGKVWVAEMFDYPSGVEGDFGPGGRIRVLESSRDDGQIDRASIFLDGIPFPTGVTVWRKGILVCAAPDILYAEDTDGNGRADVVRKLYSGFGTDNYQARVNSLEIGLDGWVYGSCGLFGGSIKSFASDQPFELGDRDFRIRPDTGEIEAATGRTQQGRVRDDFGNWFGCNNSALCFHYPLADHYVRRNPAAPPPPAAATVPSDKNAQRLIPASEQLQLFKLSGAGGSATAACGLGIYRDSLLGENFTGNAFTCEPVNLLVHRLALSPLDSTFAGSRPAEEANHEFLSSTDTWFRPVQARTAPDGSLWILDMYRFVIEHPRWIPSDSLANIDLRAGSSLGRIYRIRPRNSAVRRWPRLNHLSTKDLVDALDTPNGWQRDMAMQLLVWNKDTSLPAAIEPLKRLCRDATNGVVRLQALATLNQLGQVTASQVEQALQDQHPAVRRSGLMLSEAFVQSSGEVSTQLLKRAIALAADQDGQVRLQAACSLGAWSDASAAVALAELSLGHAQDRYLQAAVLSSLHRANVGPLVDRLLAGDPDKLAALAPKLLPVAFALSDREVAARILSATVAADDAKDLSAWQLATLSALMDYVEKHPAIADQLAGVAGFGDLVQRLAGALARARDIAVDQAMPDGLRIAAINVLNRPQVLAAHGTPSANRDEQPRNRQPNGQPDGRPSARQDNRADAPAERRSDRQLLAELLDPRSSIALQLTAVRGLLRSSAPEVAGELLSPWNRLSPQIKSAVLDGLTSRREWTEILLDQLESSQVASSEIDAARRERLLTHASADIRQRAEKILAGKLNPDRAQVLESYASVSTLHGDAERGRALFSKNCSTCHRLGEMGATVGPDLAPLASKPTAFFLQEILDPNRNLDSRYMSYTAVTDSGRTLSGLLAAETGTAITLRGADAKEEVLQRDELEQLSSSRSSLMPEGLERLLSPQDMSDVIAFVRTTADQPAETAPQSLAAGELARDLLNDALPGEARQKLVDSVGPAAAEVITAMAANMPRDEKEEYRRIPWIWRVAVAAGKGGDETVLRQVLDSSLPRQDQTLRDWQAVVIGGGVINGLGLRGDWPRGRINAILAGSGNLQKRWHAAVAASAAMADNTSVRTGTRYDALRMVAMAPWPDCRARLLNYLGKEVNAELQMGAVSGLVDVEDTEAAQLLISHFSDLTPNNRRLAITGLLRSDQRKSLLLDAFESKKIDVGQLSAEDRQGLRGSSNRDIAERAKKMLAD